MVLIDIRLTWLVKQVNLAAQNLVAKVFLILCPEN